MARLSSLAAFALGMAGSLFPEAARAQEYPWCVLRESYLDCAYTTQEQCQWTGHRRMRIESAFTLPEYAGPSRGEV